MNPGLVVKLRPAGPWRIGPDSGARNQVDVLYHSDSLYSAVTWALGRLGSLEEWLNATARSAFPSVSFSSLFPFIEEIGFVSPPRTIWPPSAPALLAARVRWKSARFVPLGIVQALLAGKSLDENQWAVDGPSGCLVPAGRIGPFRTSLRFNAAVDRLSGAAERHSIACLEFRPGAGLWGVISFSDERARSRWAERLQVAIRLLADSGFGGERSRGWGRAETPEFVEGRLPDMIMGEQHLAAGPVETVRAQAVAAEATPVEAASVETASMETAAETSGETAAPDANAGDAANSDANSDAASDAASDATTGDAATGPPAIEEPQVEAVPLPPSPVSGLRPHWLLSLFTPAAGDSVDWNRGNYTVLDRGGRVESPVRSGELKKQLPMVAEGSVLYAASALRGAAPDVAPDGFAHPVFRAGFALAIPLPEAG